MEIIHSSLDLDFIGVSLFLLFSLLFEDRWLHSVYIVIKNTIILTFIGTITFLELYLETDFDFYKKYEEMRRQNRIEEMLELEQERIIEQRIENINQIKVEIATFLRTVFLWIYLFIFIFVFL